MLAPILVKFLQNSLRPIPKLPAYLAVNPAISFNYANEKAPVVKEVLPRADTTENVVFTGKGQPRCCQFC
jgi:hypothetical protein